MTSSLTQSIQKSVRLIKPLAVVFVASASVFAAASPARADFQVFLDPSYGSSNDPNPTGVTGTLTFGSFTGTGGLYTFDLTLSNTTPSPPFTSSTFVGAAFNLPDGVSTSLANYNPLTSDFYELYLPASLNIGGGPVSYDVGIRTGTAPKKLISNPNTFNGGNPTGGVGLDSDNDPSTFLSKTVRFTVNASGFADVGLFEAAFSTLLRDSADVQSVGRFQQVTCTNPDLCSVIVNGGSDKIGGGPGIPDPDPGPEDGNSVPGPLPLLGIGVAYSYSRRLRRRIEKKNNLSQSIAQIDI